MGAKTAEAPKEAEVAVDAAAADAAAGDPAVGDPAVEKPKSVELVKIAIRVDPDNQPISRLYSAGELGSFWGWMYNGGGNNAEALCTGQTAGKKAAAAKPWSAG